MTKEINRLCHRKTFENKKAIKQAVDFVEDEPSRHYSSVSRFL